MSSAAERPDEQEEPGASRSGRRRASAPMVRWLAIDLLLLVALGAAAAGVVALSHRAGSAITSQSALVTAPAQAVTAPVAGTVAQAPAAAGGPVAAGAALFSIEPAAGSATVVRAPVAGTLGSVLAPAGTTVSAGETLASVVPSGDMEVVAMVSEGAIHRVHPGQRADVSLAVDPGAVVHGRVLAIWPLTAQSYIGSSAVPAPPAQEFLRQTALVPVAISLDRQPRGLASGESAEVTIDVGNG